MADAREAGVHFIAGGHYATETFGVRRLGELVAERFGVEHRFVESRTRSSRRASGDSRTLRTAVETVRPSGNNAVTRGNEERSAMAIHLTPTELGSRDRDAP